MRIRRVVSADKTQDTENIVAAVFTTRLDSGEESRLNSVG